MTCVIRSESDYRREFKQGGLSITATGDLARCAPSRFRGHRFYIATLFQPQLSSTHDTPHPIGSIPRVRSRAGRRRLIKIASVAGSLESMTAR